MLTRIMQLFERPDSERRTQSLPAREQRLAAAALLVHAARIDGHKSAAEEEKLQAILSERFALSQGELDALLGAAGKAEEEAVDLYRFTSVLCRHLDQAGRQQIVRMLWEIAFADDILHAYEENLIWRVAELLGVSSRDRIRLKKAVVGRTAYLSKQQRNED